MDNFVFALNATIPLFLVILLGWFLKKVGLLNENFNSVANQYVFKCALPFSLFQSISQMDFYSDFDPGFFLFCFLVTEVMFFGIWGLTALLMKNRAYVGAFSQAAVRASSAILGIALAENIYGDSGMVPMMILASVPFFNLNSVLILSFSPQTDGQGHVLPPVGDRKTAIRKALYNIMTNPIIIGILLGIPFSLLRIQLPVILTKTISTVAGTASPVALIVIGASLSMGDIQSRKWPALLASCIKLFILPAIFLPPAVLLGFRNSEMIAIMIMVGSPTTVAAYVMARSMHGDGPLTANVVALTTLLSSVSITLWLTLLKATGLV